MLSMARRLLYRIARKREFEVPPGVTFEEALHRTSSKIGNVGSFVSIGAGRGAEIHAVADRWPRIQALLVDMDSQFEPSWRELAQRYPGLRYATCAVGARDQDGYFTKSDSVGGVLSVTGDQATKIRTIDTLVAEHAMQPPYFLKFDTHGVELEILTGARTTLLSTAIIMMEVYNFKLKFAGGKNLTFDEMSLHLKTQGFRCVDICEPLFRPGDQALWQFHMFFIRDDHPIWRHSGFQRPSNAG